MDTSDFYSHLSVITKYNNYAQKILYQGLQKLIPKAEITIFHS